MTVHRCLRYTENPSLVPGEKKKIHVIMQELILNFLVTYEEI